MALRSPLLDLNINDDRFDNTELQEVAEFSMRGRLQLADEMISYIIYIYNCREREGNEREVLAS